MLFVVKTLEGERYIVITVYYVNCFCIFRIFCTVIIILRICTIPAYSVYQLYGSGRSSSADSALEEGSNFYTQQGHYDRHNACHTPRARMMCSASHSIKSVISQVGALWTAYGIDCKGTMP